MNLDFMVPDWHGELGQDDGDILWADPVNQWQDHLRALASQSGVHDAGIADLEAEAQRLESVKLDTPASPVKGSLLGYGTAPLWMPPGTAGSALVADPASESGVAWSASAGGGGAVRTIEPVTAGGPTGVNRGTTPLSTLAGSSLNMRLYVAPHDNSVRSDSTRVSLTLAVGATVMQGVPGTITWAGVIPPRLRPAAEAVIPTGWVTHSTTYRATLPAEVAANGVALLLPGVTTSEAALRIQSLRVTPTGDIIADMPSSGGAPTNTSLQFYLRGDEPLWTLPSA